MNSNLNSPQQRAALHVDGPILVLAGPGSGKTRVLVHRIARLIEIGAAKPSEILAMTFTNKAAREMRRRIEKLAGPCARDINMGTFHSVCLQYLRRHAEEVGYGDRFVVYDDSDQISLMKECLRYLNLDQKRIEPRTALERISRAKDSCIWPEEFSLKAKGNLFLEQIARLYSRYQFRLKELQAMDFGDLISLTVKLFDSRQDVLEAAQHRWRYLLVDEYQDTNNAQYRLIQLLAKGHKNICAVGDDDQSIYRWRGADISNILRFERDFEGAEVVRLEQNYRSTKSILAAAQAVVARNSGRKPKEIWTANGVGSKVRVISCETERSEAEEVARRIVAGCSDGKKFSDYAIFYRTNAQSRAFEDIFRAASISYRIYGGMRFYERAEVKDALAYLRLVADPRDDISFRRVINVPARGIGATTVERLYDFAASKSVPMFDAIIDYAKDSGSRAKSLAMLAEFRSMILSIREGFETRKLSEILHEVLDKSGYINDLAATSSIESEAKLENINELMAACAEFMPQNEGPELMQFLDQVALASDVDNYSEEQGSVTMMTLHLAKGLEFPAVFMVGLEEGVLPHARALDDPDELEEERRLCYVGMTRAEQELCLTHAFRRRIFGSEKYNVASRFLDELPHQHIDRPFKKPSVDFHSQAQNYWSIDRNAVGGYSKVGAPAPAVKRPFVPSTIVRKGGGKNVGAGACSLSTNGFTSDFNSDFDQRPPEEQSTPFSIGKKIKHPSFGVGIIRLCERTQSGHKLTVRFSDGQEKRLIAEFAGLMPI